MKKVVLTLAATLACVAAFAQGRISFQPDSLHLVYYDSTVVGHTNGDAVYVGNTTINGSTYTFAADLYVGTSSNSLALISSTTFSAVSPGKFATANCQIPATPGSTAVFVVAQIRDASFAAPATWTPASLPFGTYYGVSQEFSFILGTSTITYPAMYTQGGVTQGTGTWALGQTDMTAYAPGFKGAIAVSAVPEPATFALCGLGAAALMIFRRRK